MWKELIATWRSDNLLDQAWGKSYEMLDIDRAMFLEAVRVLRDTDGDPISMDIRKKDKEVNAFEREVRRKVITHCSVQGGQTIPSGIVLVSIVIDIERIGDYTKNILDLAEHFKQRLDGGKFEQDLQRVEVAVKDNFHRTKAAIETSDKELTLKLLKEYEWVIPLCDKTLKQLIREKKEKLNPGEAVTLALYFRWLKRIYAHLRNICTSVVNPVDGIGFKPEI